MPAKKKTTPNITNGQGLIPIFMLPNTPSTPITNEIAPPSVRMSPNILIIMYNFEWLILKIKIITAIYQTI